MAIMPVLPGSPPSRPLLNTSSAPRLLISRLESAMARCARAICPTSTTASIAACRPWLIARKYPKMTAFAAAFFLCSSPLTLPLLIISSPLFLLTSLLTISFNRCRCRWQWQWPYSGGAALCLFRGAKGLLFPKAESRPNLITLWKRDHSAEDPLPCSFFYKIEGFDDELGEAMPDFMAQFDFSWNQVYTL